MPLRDELIQRAIQQLAASFARLLSRSGPAGAEAAAVSDSAAAAELAPGPADRAEAAALREQLDKLYSAFMGSSAQLVLRLSSDDLIRVLGSAGYVDGERAYLLSSLLETEAQLLISEGASVDDDAVLDMRSRALDLMLEAGSSGLGEPDISARVARLLPGVPPDLRTNPTWERLVWFGFDTGDFAVAENALYDWLDEAQATGADSSPVGVVGEKLYGALAALKDEALDSGGLPRAELEEGSVELERRLSA